MDPKPAPADTPPNDLSKEGVMGAMRRMFGQPKRPPQPADKARALMRQVAPAEVEGTKRRGRMDRAIDSQAYGDDDSK